MGYWETNKLATLADYQQQVIQLSWQKLTIRHLR